jgi:hypothetical protein
MVRGHHLMTLEALVIHQKIKKKIWGCYFKKCCFPQLVKISLCRLTITWSPHLFLTGVYIWYSPRELAMIHFYLFRESILLVGILFFIFLFFLSLLRLFFFFLVLVRDLGLDSTTSETPVSFRYHSLGLDRHYTTYLLICAEKSVDKTNFLCCV